MGTDVFGSEEAKQYVLNKGTACVLYTEYTGATADQKQFPPVNFLTSH